MNNQIADLQKELAELKDTVYGENGLSARLTAADAGWARWQLEAYKLEKIIQEVHSWIVCAAITTPEDMAQNFERIEQITNPDYRKRNSDD